MFIAYDDLSCASTNLVSTLYVDDVDVIDCVMPML